MTYSSPYPYRYAMICAQSGIRDGYVGLKECFSSGILTLARYRMHPNSSQRMPSNSPLKSGCCIFCYNQFVFSDCFPFGNNHDFHIMFLHLLRSANRFYYDIMSPIIRFYRLHCGLHLHVQSYRHFYAALIFAEPDVAIFPRVSLSFQETSEYSRAVTPQVISCSMLYSTD